MKSSFNDPKFQRALDHVLRFEGGFVDHPRDPGGATKFGITRRTLASWRQVSPWWKLPKTAVKRLGRVETSKIYYSRYWKTCGAQFFPDAIGFAVFDFAVNSGPPRAIKQLQRLLKIKPDGTVGSVTRAAVSTYCAKRSEKSLVQRYVERRHGFLKKLSTYAVFGRGWRNRLKQFLVAARPMMERKTQQKEDKPMNLLAGYKTYLIALFMLLTGVLELLGVNVPTIDAGNAAHLVMEALAIIFLRKGIKTEISNA